ncbi:hypothetical protein [Staphylococcus cohnii]|uniref:hypothetical protein n=1 Tax=Staphylococcus cohnii TaxID=29382 RepID=UPI0018668A49|nr:hypothetical protein [Staphylococcus cohnii]
MEKKESFFRNSLNITPRISNSSGKASYKKATKIFKRKAYQALPSELKDKLYNVPVAKPKRIDSMNKIIGNTKVIINGLLAFFNKPISVMIFLFVCL